MLAIIGASYNERLRSALSSGDVEMEKELMHFVAMDFQKTFRVNPSQLPARKFSGLLLDNLKNCDERLPELERLLGPITARNR